MKNMKRVAEGIYRHVKSDGTWGSLYERVHQNGRDTYVKLSVSRLSEARAARAANILQFERFMSGDKAVTNPYGCRAAVTFSDLLEKFLEAGCPGKRRVYERSSETLYRTQRALHVMSTWPGWNGLHLDRITPQVIMNYGDWRRKEGNVTNGRSIDIEVTALKSMLRWAVLRGHLLKSPLYEVELPSQQFAAPKKCREARPKDAKELHDIARYLFRGYRSQVLGFQVLFEAFTGVRTKEALRCRWDAKPYEPGFIDKGVLHISRSKKGVKPWITIHPALQALLDAMKKWNEGRPRKSVWFFPTYLLTEEPVSPKSLVQALERLPGKEIGEDSRVLVPANERRTSHGLRAYYVTVRRSQGVDDAVIAAEIGDKTGAAIIASTYGDLPPNWLDTTVGKLTWVPEGEAPAWEILCKTCGGSGHVDSGAVSPWQSDVWIPCPECRRVTSRVMVLQGPGNAPAPENVVPIMAGSALLSEAPRKESEDVGIVSGCTSAPQNTNLEANPKQSDAGGEIAG